MNKLEEITVQRGRDVESAKVKVPPSELNQRIQKIEEKFGPALNVLERLNAPSKDKNVVLALAAEFKRASPSKGDIAVDLDIEEQVQVYADAGASMISVLTEPKWFKGSLEDMMKARETVDNLPNRPAILRKDFVIDEYQLLEARAYGADCVLLIVAILTPELLQRLITATCNLGMCPLVEVNNTEELEIALNANAKLIGVNNRNLRTFKLDLETTVRIAENIRNRGISLGIDGVTLFALSGIHSRADAKKFEDCGARGILVGESLMKCGDVHSKIANLLGSTISETTTNDLKNKKQKPLVKVCGITKVEFAIAAVRAGADLIGLIFVKKSPRCVDISTAKEIASAVRNYGERTSSILPAFIAEQCSSTPTGKQWFQNCSKGLRSACSRAPLVVGVFANATVDEMNEVALEVGLDIVQLHGDEGFDLCSNIVVPTIRVVHMPKNGEEKVDTSKLIQDVTTEGSTKAHFILLDTSVKGQKGGTGATFDWSIAKEFAEANLPCLLAGGLLPQNVSEAIQISTPMGVDVSSGVEIDQSPGVKDLEKISLFVKTAKA